MYGRGRSGITSLTNYAAAKTKYETTKHIRGRDTEQRPLGDRRRSHFQIRKVGDDIACKLYETDVVTYHPDNTITLRVPEQWRTTTTATFIMDVLGRYRAGAAIRDHDVVLWLKGANAAYLRVGEATKLKVEDNGYLTLLSNDREHYVHAIDRKRMTELRKSIKPFRDYVRAALNLREGKFGFEEADVLRDFLRDNDIYPDALGSNDGWNVKKHWSLDLPGDRWFNSYTGDTLEKWKDRAAKVVKMMQSKDTEMFYGLMLLVAYTTKITASPANFSCSLEYMENIITSLLIATHPDVLVKRSEALNMVERDRYTRFNFLFKG